jgi:alpha-beta hydrolase superfamily lysophospholipase
VTLRALFREPDAWNFSWISSPLVHPEGTRSAVEAWFLLMLSRIIPFISVDSGVGPKECVTGDDKPKQDRRLPEDDEPNLFHRRITLGWAQEICETARWVRQQFAGGFPDVPTLFTQGGDDPVCRADTLRRLVEGIPPPRPALEILPGLRHEPFADPQKAIFLDLLGSFLDREVISALPRRDRAGGI